MPIIGLFRVEWRQGVASKPFLVSTQAVETKGHDAPDDPLGARDVILVAYSDLLEADYLIMAGERVALARGWIEKPFAQMGAKLLKAGERVAPNATSTKTGKGRPPTPPNFRREGNWNPFD